MADVPVIFVARVSTQLRLKRMADQLRMAAATDGLTGVANRRKFDHTLEQEWQRALRSADPLSLSRGPMRKKAGSQGLPACADERCAGAALDGATKMEQTPDIYR